MSLGELVSPCIVDLSFRVDTLDGVMLVSAVDLTAGRGASFGQIGLGQPCVDYADLELDDLYAALEYGLAPPQ